MQISLLLFQKTGRDPAENPCLSYFRLLRQRCISPFWISTIYDDLTSLFVFRTEEKGISESQPQVSGNASSGFILILYLARLNEAVLWSHIHHPKSKQHSLRQGVCLDVCDRWGLCYKNGEKGNQGARRKLRMCRSNNWECSLDKALSRGVFLRSQMVAKESLQ